MGLFYTNVQTTVRPNINIRFKELKKPLKDIEEAIIKSNDKLIESQKEKFIELEGLSIRVSLIEALTEINDNKFSIIFSSSARSDNITYEGETTLLTRKAYNKIASALGIDLSLPVCVCGEPTESLDNHIVSRFSKYDLPSYFETYCPQCRKKILLLDRLYRHNYDMNNDQHFITFLDGQTMEITREFLRERNLNFNEFPRGIL